MTMKSSIDIGNAMCLAASLFAGRYEPIGSILNELEVMINVLEDKQTPGNSERVSKAIKLLSQLYSLLVMYKNREINIGGSSTQKTREGRSTRKTREVQEDISILNISRILTEDPDILNEKHMGPIGFDEGPPRFLLE